MKIKQLSILILVVLVASVFAACAGEVDITTTAPVSTSIAPETGIPGTTTTTVVVTTTTAPVTTPVPVIINPLEDPRFDIGDDTVVYTFSEEDAARINEKIDRLDAMLLEAKIFNETDYAAFEALYEDVVDIELEYVLTQRSIAGIYFSLTPYHGSAEADDEYVSEYYTSAAQRLIVMYQTIYDSPFKDSFYEDWTEEEIADALLSAAEYTDEMIALIDKRSDLIREYNGLEAREFDDGMRRIYLELVEVNNTIAALAGYDNYMDYAYAEIYGREYTPEESHAVAENIIAHLLPQIEAILDKFTEDLMAADYSTRVAVSNFVYESSRTYKSQVYFEKLAKLIGGDYLESYEYLWSDGIYFMAKDGDISLPQAYTTYLYDRGEPALYFGPGYDNIGTIVHEFGHYYAYRILGERGADISIDLAEVHSQANEWMFYSKLDEYMLGAGVDLIVEYYMVSSLQALLLSTLVNEFEIAVYNAEDLTAESFDVIFNDVCEQFGGRLKVRDVLDYDPSEYWPLVVVDNSGYYISYAMSMIPSLEMYSIAVEDINKAIEVYNKLVHIPEEQEDISFTTVITNAGFKGPFSEESYIAIAKAVDAMMDGSTEATE